MNGAAELTWKANWPEKSYMPQECMRLRVLRTASALSTLSPVMGQIPPLARVAAMTLPDSQVTSTEHSYGDTAEVRGRGGPEHCSWVWSNVGVQIFQQVPPVFLKDTRTTGKEKPLSQSKECSLSLFPWPQLNSSVCLPGSKDQGQPSCPPP